MKFICDTVYNNACSLLTLRPSCRNGCRLIDLDTDLFY